jgi:hypothetical protein
MKEKNVPGDGSNVYWKEVYDTLVASVRVNGKHGDIDGHLRRLSESVGSRAHGHPFVLYRGGDDMEMCLPVTGPPDDDSNGGPAPGGSPEISFGTLGGSVMMCAPFEGDMGSDDTARALGEEFGKLWRHTLEHHIGVTEDPWREVLLDYEPGTSGPYRAELQVPMLLPKWLERLRTGLDRHAGVSVRQHVLGGSERLYPSSSRSEKVAWVKGAMARLDAAVGDEKKRRAIMGGCAHVYPAARIAALKREYERLGSVNALIEFIAKDSGYDGAPYYRDPERVGNVIFIDKIPQERDKHAAATDPLVKRAAACHCPIVKAAILAGENVSFTYCNCGTGWFKPVWETILEAPVNVVCEESVLRGDDRCKFAIYLPEE